MLSLTLTLDSATLPVVGDVVGPGHRAADGHRRAVGRAGDGRAVVVGAVGQLDDVDVRSSSRSSGRVVGRLVGVGSACRWLPACRWRCRCCVLAGVAVPLAVKTQVSPGSSRPSSLVSPTLKPPERTGRVDARDVVADGDAAERTLPVGDVVGPGDGAADGDDRAVGRACDRRVVVVGAVGQLDDVDVGSVAEVVVGVVAVTGMSPGWCCRRGHGVPVAVPMLLYWPAVAVPLAVYTQVSPGSSRPLSLVSPTLKPPESTGVGLTPAMLSVTLTLVSGHVGGVGDVVGPGHRAADRHVGPSGVPATGGLSLLVPLVSLTMLMPPGSSRSRWSRRWPWSGSRQPGCRCCR